MPEEESFFLWSHVNITTHSGSLRVQLTSTQEDKTLIVWREHCPAICQDVFPMGTNMTCLSIFAVIIFYLAQQLDFVPSISLIY